MRNLAGVLPDVEIAAIAPLLAEIEALKAKRNAVVLAHNYMTPDIFHGVADLRGDSLALARMAEETEADVIVMAGVHFMAETAKILNPAKTVLIPDLRAGCSLAESITGADVRLLRQRYPGVPVVTYVNTSAEVKAESDICCTSGNAVAVVESLGADRVIFLPDQYLGRWVASQTGVEVILWEGSCMVHERFTGAQLREYRADHPGIRVIAHPECPPDVLDEADFVGSTAGMISWVEKNRPPRVVMVTECSMSDNVAAEIRDVEFVRPCNLCPHMKRITLAGIARRAAPHAPRGQGAAGGRRARAPRRHADARRQAVIADDFITAPAVVVGGGIAGLATALALDGCVVVAGGPIGDGASRLAQGGIAAAIGADDAPALHAADTLAVSAGLAAADIAALVTGDAPDRIDWLRGMGVGFDLDANGEPALGREAGHRRHRIVHAGGDRTGAAVMQALAAAVRRRPDIRVLEGFSLVDIVTARCARGRRPARRPRTAPGSPCSRRTSCSRPAASAPASSARPTRRARRARASPPRRAAACGSPTSSSCSFTRPRSRSRAIPSRS